MLAYERTLGIIPLEYNGLALELIERSRLAVCIGEFEGRRGLADLGIGECSCMSDESERSRGCNNREPHVRLLKKSVDEQQAREVRVGAPVTSR